VITLCGLIRIYSKTKTEKVIIEIKMIIIIIIIIIIIDTDTQFLELNSTTKFFLKLSENCKHNYKYLSLGWSENAVNTKQKR